MSEDNDDVYIVIEDEVGEMVTIRRAFDNAQAANNYVEDPDQLGRLYVANVTVESSYEIGADEANND